MNAMLNTLRKMFRSAPRLSAPRGVRLRLEALEERCVPSMTQITPPPSYPATAIVAVVSVFPDGQKIDGTGAMLDSDHVLTAGTMIYDPQYGTSTNPGWATQIAVFAGTTSSTNNVAWAYATTARVEPAFYNTMNWNWATYGGFGETGAGIGDIGLLSLSNNLNIGTSYFQLDYTDKYNWTGASLYTMGYTQPSTDGFEMFQQYGPITGAVNAGHYEGYPPPTYDTPSPGPGYGPFNLFAFGYFDFSQSNIQMQTGEYSAQSGSPLFRYDFGQPYIYGVMSVADSSTGYAEQITQLVYNDLTSWLDADNLGTTGVSPSDADPSLVRADLPTQTTVQATANGFPFSYGQSVTFTAYVQTPGTPCPYTTGNPLNAGMVTFKDNGTVLGTAYLEPTSSTRDSASFTTSTLSAGSHSITAVYSGEAVYLAPEFQGSTSGAYTGTVLKAQPTTNLTGPTGSVVAGQPATFTAYVSGSGGAYPTGTVKFYDGATVLGTAQLRPYNNSIFPVASASFTTSALGVGRNSITAVYSGDSNYQSGASGAVTATVKPAQPDPVFALFADNSLWEYTTAGWQELSPAGTILSISSVTDGAGNDDVYAITADRRLWEHSSGWALLSTGSFQSISAATNKSGNAVVFAVLTDGSLWEQDPAHGVGVNAGWALLSPAGTILSISAITDAAGNDVVFAVATAGPDYLWEHSPALPGNGWAELSTGSFASVGAGVNGAGQAVAYGVLTDGSLWEQNPAFGPVGLNSGWRLLSPAGTILAASAAGPDQVFAVTADHRLWQHTAASGWSLTSTGSFASISGENNGGAGEVFAVLTDGSLWEYTTGWAELDVGVLAVAAPRRG